MMTEGVFDFKKESNEILDRFPQLRNTTVFITTENAARRVTSVSRYPLSLSFVFDAVAVSGLKAWVKESYDWGCSIAGASKQPPYDVVVFKHDDPSHQAFGPDSQLMLQMTALNHEAGHFLMPGAHPDNKPNEYYPITETAPDAFATLMSLQRFEHAPEVSRLYAWRRAYNFIDQGTSCHMTAPVIDAILDDAAVRDFSGLTAQQTIETAQAYARNRTPREEEIRRAKAAYAPYKGMLRKPETLNLRTLKNIAETALGSAHVFTFHIGTRAFQPFLDGEAITCKGQAITLPREMRDHYRRAFAAKAGQLGEQKMAAAFAQKKTDQPQGRSVFPVTIRL